MSKKETAKADKKAAPKMLVSKTARRKAARAKRAAAKPAVAGGKATLSDVRISAQKARLAIRLIVGKQVEPALQLLQFTPKKSTALVYKLLKSAIANAREHGGADVDKLWVTGAWADAGKTLKRIMPRARGMATTILKRSAHITVVVEER